MIILTMVIGAFIGTAVSLWFSSRPLKINWGSLARDFDRDFKQQQAIVEELKGKLE